MKNQTHSESDFQRLFESAPGLYLVLRPDLTITAVSAAYLQATMTTRAGIIGKGLFEVFPDNPDDPTATGSKNLRTSLERVLSSRAPDRMPTQKYDIRRPEAAGGGFEVRYWSLLNTPVPGEDGEIAYLLHSVEDVTKSINAEGERNTIEQERDLFFTYSLDMLAIVGKDGYFKRLNPSFQRVLGYTDDELYAKPLVEFLHPDDVGKTKGGIQKLAVGIPRMATENRYLCKDGTYKWISWNTAPLGSVFCTVGRDITDRVNSEERIRELNSELEKKNDDLEQIVHDRLKELRQSEAQVQQLQKMDAIGRLAGGIAHDFNNMLGAISMYCDLLADRPENAEAVRENIRDIRTVTTRAAALTRQLLIFSRKQIVQLQTISLNPLIQQLEKMLARLIGENIKIEMKLATDLKATKIDPSQMEQVVLNLVVNARDALPQGGKITIETSNVYLDKTFTYTHLSVNEGHYALLSVTDNGSGMSESTLSKIFEPFFTTKPVGKGTGLGLTTAYGIVKQCKGTIWVYSELGKGTVFKVYLPVADSIATMAEPVAEKPQEVISNRTILLVEDDPSLRAGFSAMLRRHGYQVLVASNGAEALQLCQSHTDVIHLLLTDVVMPELSGFELAKKITALRGKLHVLYMSGYTNDTLEDSGMEQAGNFDFIQKPFNFSALTTKLQEILAR